MNHNETDRNVAEWRSDPSDNKHQFSFVPVAPIIDGLKSGLSSAIRTAAFEVARQIARRLTSNLLRALPCVLLAIAGLAAVKSATLAANIYTTFGEPGDIYNAGAGWLVNGSESPPQPYMAQAFPFTASGSGYLDRISLAMGSKDKDLATGVANIWISIDAVANVPGPRLETFSNVETPGRFGEVYPITVLNSATRPMLAQGRTYWLCVEPAFPTASVSVNQNVLGIMALQAQLVSSGSWVMWGNRTTFAYSVDVTPVPEPSVGMFCWAAMCLVGRRWPRAHRAVRAGDGSMEV